MKLAHRDRMNEYVRYESKAVFACPPGLAGGGRTGVRRCSVGGSYTALGPCASTAFRVKSMTTTATAAATAPT